MEVEYQTVYGYVPGKGQVMYGKSLTVPDEAISIGEIMRRVHSGAMVPPIAGSLEYGEDETFDQADDPEDLVEAYDTMEKLNYLQRQYAELKAQKLREKEEAASKADDGEPQDS